MKPDTWEGVHEGGVGDTVLPPSLLDLELAGGTSLNVGMVSSSGFGNQACLVRFTTTEHLIPVKRCDGVSLAVDALDDVRTESGGLSNIGIDGELFEI